MQEKFLNLTGVAYKLLEYFPELDLSAVKAREKILAIMEGLVLVEGTENNQKIKEKIAEDIEMLLGYFKIGKTQGWISQMNYLIISSEYAKIKQKIIATSDVAIIVVEKPQEQRTQKVAEPVLDKSGSQKKESQNFVKLSDRQQKIIKFLSDKEKAQVMDLQEVLPTVTKRTIRRDLDELLATGKVVRLGEFNQVFYKVNQVNV
jgi:DNA-binding transcriptional ArsR family regulator